MVALKPTAGRVKEDVADVLFFPTRAYLISTRRINEMSLFADAAGDGDFPFSWVLRRLFCPSGVSTLLANLKVQPLIIEVLEFGTERTLHFSPSILMC